jgi:hypothetical protein
VAVYRSGELESGDTIENAIVFVSNQANSFTTVSALIILAFTK